MRFKTIVLCTSFLLHSLSSCDANSRDCPRKYGGKEIEPATDNSDLLGVTTTTSSATLRIKLGEMAIEKCLWRLYRYRPRFAVRAPAKIDVVQNRSCTTPGYFVAKEAHGLYDSSDPRGCSPRYTAHQKIIFVTLQNLRFPGVEYEVEIETYYLSSRLIRKTKGVFRTQPVVPAQPPNTGAGCFHIFREHPTSGARTVKVYWQQVLEESTVYELEVYESNDEQSSSPVFEEVGPLARGFTVIDIGSKAHYFIFRSRNDAGRSKTFSSVFVPAKEDVLPTPSTLTRSNRQNGTYTLTWKRPDKVEDVSNYTVFWLDSFDRGAALHVKDFVVVSSESESFEIDSDGWIGLGMSVNTAMSSSGLQAVHYE